MNIKHMKKFIFTTIALAVVATVGVPQTTEGANFDSSSLGLAPGSPFRMVFLTDGTTQALSQSVVLTYDPFVSNAASAANYTIDGNSVTWNAIATGNDNGPRLRLSLDPTGLDNNTPIYLATGTNSSNIIANTYADLWDGMIDNLLDYDETFTQVSGENRVWTGTKTTGFPDNPPGGRLGVETSPTYGFRTITASQWIDANLDNVNRSTSLRMYAISERLLTTAIPEPGTYLLLGSMLMLVAYSRKKRVSKRSVVR